MDSISKLGYKLFYKINDHITRDQADEIEPVDPEKAHEYNLKAHELVVERRTLLLSKQ